MARKRRPDPDPYAQQAHLTAALRYAPKYEALRNLLAEAASSRDQSIAGAETSARGTTQAIDAARPQVAQIYADAGYDPAKAAAPPQLPSGAVDFATAAQFEQGAGQRRLGVAQARAQQDLENLKLAAASGKSFANKQARDQYTAAAFKVGQQFVDLGDQQGAFEAVTLGQLHQKGAERALKRRGQNITLRGQNIQQALGQSRIDATYAGQEVSRENNIRSTGVARENNIRSNANRGRNGGVGWLSQGQHNTLAGNISQAQSSVEDFVKHAVAKGKGRGWINAQLARGIPGYTEHDPKTGRIRLDPKSGAPIVQPGLKPIGEIERNVVLDQIIYGRVTPVTARKLHRMGYSTRGLGLTVGAAPRRKPAKSAFGRNPFTKPIRG